MMAEKSFYSKPEYLLVKLNSFNIHTDIIDAYLEVYFLIKDENDSIFGTIDKDLLVDSVFPSKEILEFSETLSIKENMGLLLKDVIILFRPPL